jgi:hypothetical protein
VSRVTTSTSPASGRRITLASSGRRSELPRGRPPRRNRPDSGRPLPIIDETHGDWRTGQGVSERLCERQRRAALERLRYSRAIRRALRVRGVTRLKCDPWLFEQLAVALEAHQHGDLRARTRLLDRCRSKPSPVRRQHARVKLLAENAGPSGEASRHQHERARCRIVKPRPAREAHH